MKKEKVAIYCRESTEKQDIEGLVSMCEVQAKKLGYDDYTIYKDVGSGMERNRPQYLKMLEDIKKNEINILILYESSRLTRDSLEHQATYKLLKQYDIKLYILNRGWVNPNDENDEFVSAILSILDTKEVRQIRKRAKDKMAYIKDSGFWTGGKAPLGYKLVNKKLMIDSETSSIAKEIFKLFINGETRSKIATLFNFENKKVIRILNNPIYKGYLKKNEITIVDRKPIINKNYEIVKGNHEALVSEEDWLLVQSLLQSKKREIDKKPRALKGILRCRCGGLLYHRKPSKTHPYVFYVCENSFKGTCSSKIIKETEILEAILEGLSDVISSLDLIEVYNDNSSAIKEQMAFYNKELEKIPKKEEMLLDKYLEEKIASTLYERKLKEINLKKSEYTKQLNHLERLEIDHAHKSYTKGLLNEYFNLIIQEKDPQRLNHFFKIIIDHIEMINDFRFLIHLKI